MGGWMSSPPFQNKTRLAEAAAGEDPHLLLPVMLQIKKCMREITFTQSNVKYAKKNKFIHSCSVRALSWLGLQGS